MDMNDQQLQESLRERFEALPKVVQDAILSADVEKNMRNLAEQHKLHFDQWGSLEDEVMFTLLGMEPTEKLAENLQKQVNVSADVASALANDISHIVFEPIRAQLAASLEAQEAKAAQAPVPPPAPSSSRR
jgi:superoxide dismutase